ncbi:MAG: rhodanese-like domain-containing protein [Anaerovoracaceae bacterium]
MGLFSLFGGGLKFQEALSQAKVTPGSVIVDVRTPQEFTAGHIPDSINIPLDTLDKAVGEGRLDKAAPLFVYCLSGARSAQAVKYLSNQGYTATNLGGISGYKGELI